MTEANTEDSTNAVSTKAKARVGNSGIGGVYGDGWGTVIVPKA